MALREIRPADHLNRTGSITQNPDIYEGDDITREQVEGAPKYSGEEYNWTPREERRVYDDCGAQPHW